MFWTILATLFACNDYAIKAVEIREPDILVYPDHINFGRLISGVDEEVETFTVTNTGDEDLKILAPVLVSGNTRYDLSTDQVEYTIPGGELLEFELKYRPETFEANGAYIDIESNDEDEPLSRITVEGYGDAPVMSVSPLTFDYGTISIGCDNEERITVRNDGSMDLIITSMSQMVTQPADILFELGSLPDPPWVLVPGQEMDFLVSYIPTDIGFDDSQITIQGNDPVLPEVVSAQWGHGDVEQWISQSWQQERVPVLDMLWVIDNSGSMRVFQQHLANNIGAFMTAFVQTGADYHMAVITTDDYNFSTIIDSYTPNAQAELASLVIQGTMGSAHETGLEEAYQSLDIGPAAPGGSFFREDAKLVVIFVSDEQDWGTTSINQYTSFYDNLKPAGDFIPYGVIGDPPSGCTYTMPNGNPRNAQFGAGYWDLIDYYGGKWYSICAQDWGVQLQDLAGEVTGRKTFGLEEPDPIETTIEVKVNGQVTIEWIYDANINAVVFNDGHVPEEGQTVSIDYAVWGCGQ